MMRLYINFKSLIAYEAAAKCIIKDIPNISLIIHFAAALFIFINLKCLGFSVTFASLIYIYSYSQKNASQYHIRIITYYLQILIPK